MGLTRAAARAAARELAGGRAGRPDVAWAVDLLTAAAEATGRPVNIVLCNTRSRPGGRRTW